MVDYSTSKIRHFRYRVSGTPSETGWSRAWARRSTTNPPAGVPGRVLNRGLERGLANMVGTRTGHEPSPRFDHLEGAKINLLVPRQPALKRRARLHKCRRIENDGVEAGTAPVEAPELVERVGRDRAAAAFDAVQCGVPRDHPRGRLRDVDGGHLRAPARRVHRPGARVRENVEHPAANDAGGVDAVL